MLSNQPPLLNKTMLLKLGWTPALIAAVLGQPDKEVEHKRGYCKWTEHLYARDRVALGMLDARFVALQAKRKDRAAAAARRVDEIGVRYSDWRDALPEAAAGMKQLNRYAKHKVCSAVQKVEIYQLKRQLVSLLYSSGYCTAAWIHEMHQEAQPCRECDGTGEDCCRCGYTGIWREARTLYFWCFQFSIGGVTYCWHQPRSLVEFSPVATVPPQNFEGVVHEKPVSLPVSRFAGVKRLISWVLDAALAAQEKKENFLIESPPSGFTPASSPVSPVSPSQASLFQGL